MNIVPFDSPTLPAILARRPTVRSNKLFSGSASTGFPVISIKGKVFHSVRGGDRTLITKPGEDDPAASIEVVIIDVNEHKSKVYYTGGFIEGENAKPTCYSNNGVGPEADAAEPQSKKCSTCTHNQWGSRISDSGAKGKACSDSRRLAIATPDTPADPMLMRVPAGSMKAMEEYGKILAARGVEPHEVITRIGFDYSVAHPALTFKPIGFISDAEQLAEIKRQMLTEVVGQIIGVKVIPPSDAVPPEADPEPAKAAAPAPVAQAPAPAPAPAPAAPRPARVAPADAVEKAVAAAAPTKKVNVTVEAAPAMPTQDTSALESQIGSMIDGMDFDD